ncbi:MAG: cytochrome c [Acidobacteria bacterium]|nr:cytochrome c [Acidobacteriota bacterium]
MLRHGGKAVRKIYAKVGLVVIALVFVFAILSFLRENWGADAKPGPVETFLANLILGMAHPDRSDISNPIPADEANLEEGRLLYEHQCTFCHGLEGTGLGENGIQFYPPVPSLVEEAHEYSDGQLHAIVSRGIRYTAMPSFAKALQPDQIWKVILWVRHLSRPSEQAQQSLSLGESPTNP